MILKEFDKDMFGLINPSDIVSKIEGFPEVGISCFSKKLLDKVVENFDATVIAEISSANGRIPVYKINYKGTDVAVFMSRVGAPACTISYEEVLAMGLEKLVLFGTCGVLDSKIEDLAIIVPNSAIRDEGTSYHYMESSDEIVVNKKYKDTFEEILNVHNYSYIEGKTWTIDAPYRETKDKILKRKSQGCVCVEMECSAMFAVAEFRGKDLFQFLYAADNLDGSKWDKRSLGNDSKLSEKEKVAFLALELAIKM